MNSKRGLLIYTAVVFLLSSAYFFYLKTTRPVGVEHETFLSEIGEGFGEASLWLLLFIYARTLLKLTVSRGGIASRLVPDFETSPALPMIKRVLGYLNRTHLYVGIAGVAVIILHVALVGLPLDILFFPIVLALVVWQGLFGLFLRWKYSPTQLKRFAYLVHAQFFTGILIGIFAWFGHQLINA